MPQVKLQLNHKDRTFPLQITIEPDLVSGQRSAAGRVLNVPFEHTFLEQSITNVPNLQNLAHQCRLLGIEARMIWRNGREQREGWGPLTLTGHNFGIRLELDDATLEWFEQGREGNPVSLQVQLAALCLIPDLAHPVLAPQPNSDGRLPGSATYRYPMVTVYYGPEETTIALDRERWLEILRGMKWGDARLVELPPSEIPSSSEVPWQTVLVLLQRATTEYREGEFEKTVETVREAVEGVATELARHWGLKTWPESKKNFDEWTKELGGRLKYAWPTDPDSADLLATIFAMTWHWASSSHHYGAKTARRREAKFALQLLTDLLEFSAHLISVHSEPVISTSGDETTTPNSR